MHVTISTVDTKLSSRAEHRAQPIPFQQKTCQEHHFELRPLRIGNDPSKYRAIRCSKCGVIVGVQDEDHKKQLEQLFPKVDEIEMMLKEITRPNRRP